MNTNSNQLIKIKHNNKLGIKIAEDELDNAIVILFDNVYVYPEVVSVPNENIETHDYGNIKYNNIIKCDKCGYVGNKAIWKGKIIKNTKEIEIQEICSLLNDNTWHIDNTVDIDYDKFTGEPHCPICGNNNIY